MKLRKEEPTSFSEKLYESCPALKGMERERFVEAAPAPAAPPQQPAQGQPAPQAAQQPQLGQQGQAFQQGMTALMQVMQKNPADPSIDQHLAGLQKTLPAFMQERQQAAKAQPQQAAAAPQGQPAQPVAQPTAGAQPAQ